MPKIVAWRYRWQHDTKWVHSSEEPEAYPNRIVEPLCVASEEAVKPLEWMSEQYPFFAQSPFCRYRIDPVDDDTGPHWQTTTSYLGSVYRRSETEAEAKAAAQRDHEQRILSALGGRS